jgi:hypothetical protein
MGHQDRALYRLETVPLLVCAGKGANGAPRVTNPAGFPVYRGRYRTRWKRETTIGTERLYRLISVSTGLGMIR